MIAFVATVEIVNFQVPSSSYIFKCCNLCQQLLIYIRLLFQILFHFYKLGLNIHAHYCLQVHYWLKKREIFVITWKGDFFFNPNKHFWWNLILMKFVFYLDQSVKMKNIGFDKQEMFGGRGNPKWVKAT